MKNLVLGILLAFSFVFSSAVAAEEVYNFSVKRVVLPDYEAPADQPTFLDSASDVQGDFGGSMTIRGDQVTYSAYFCPGGTGIECENLYDDFIFRDNVGPTWRVFSFIQLRDYYLSVLLWDDRGMWAMLPSDYGNVLIEFEQE